VTSLPSQGPEVSVPVRGAVQRSFVDMRVLSGFTDDGHFRNFVQEYLDSLSGDDQRAVLEEADRTRAAARALPVVPLDDVVVDPLVNDYVKRIQADEDFQMTFRGVRAGFAWVNPEHIVALQVFVKPRADAVAADEAHLMEFALPNNWDVPAELSFIPPLGPIQIVTSSPNIAGVRARLEARAGRIIIEPPPHVNLVLVSHSNGRYYLRNGYHRMYDMLSARLRRVPALVIEATQPTEVELGNLGFGGFSAGYVLGLARPPLVSDFLTSAALNTRIRLRRYGVSVSLQLSPLNIGI
jgi:hypothetical protein